MNSQPNHPFQVLVADDSEIDRVFIKDALQHASRLQLAHEVPDGAQVIAYLEGRGEFADRERFAFPDLLLLDLNMPVMDGFEVLEWLRQQASFQLTVVVLTDSMRPADIKRALDLGADLFQVKPHTSADRRDLILALERHLLNTRNPTVPRTRSRIARSVV